MRVEQRANIDFAIISNSHSDRAWNFQKFLHHVPQRILGPQHLPRIIRHQSFASCGSDGMHEHTPQRGSRRRPLVRRSQKSRGDGFLRQHAFFQTVEHLVHEQRDFSAVSEEPQVYDELASRFLVVVICNAARVEPGDEALEVFGVLGVESDRVVFCCGPSAAESCLEVSGVEGQEAVVDVEGTPVVAFPDYDCGLRTVG
jgi:hypothetical protein